MYGVEFTADSEDQVAALPAGALLAFAGVWSFLAVAPASGDAYNGDRPDANTRAYRFGEGHEGLAIYLILERQRRVIVLKVLWIG